MGWVILILFGWVGAPYDPLTTRPTLTVLAPQAAFPLGTDTLGRDVLSRVLYGGQITVFLAMSAATIAILGGVILGICVVFGSPVLSQIALITELSLLSLPGWLIALVCITGLGASWQAIIIGVGLTQIAPFSRITAMTLNDYKHRLFVTAAESCGAPYSYLIFRVIFPNASPILMGAACITVSHSLLFASGLTFLGLGGALNTPEWGAILAEGRLAIRYAPWIAISAGVPLVLLIATVNSFARQLTLHVSSS